MRFLDIYHINDSLSIFLWDGIIEAEGKAAMAFTGVYEHVISLQGDDENEPIADAVRGLFGEGTESLGNLFQISNQSTLGESEETIIRRLERGPDRDRDGARRDQRLALDH